jgi:hypothetical protein
MREDQTLLCVLLFSFQFIFYTAGSFSLSRIDNARIADNTNPDGDEFIGFFATAGGGYEIRNSLFQNNQSVSVSRKEGIFVVHISSHSHIRNTVCAHNQ